MFAVTNRNGCGPYMVPIYVRRSGHKPHSLWGCAGMGYTHATAYLHFSQ